MTTANTHTRLSLLSKISLILLTCFIALGSLLFYLQTRHGFRHVIIPVASKFTGAKLEAQDGFISLLGELEAERLVFEGPSSGISFNAERLAIRARPWSILSEGIPQIDDLELKKANLHVVIPPGAEDIPVEEKDIEPSGKIGFIPVAVERANFEELTVIVQEEGRRTTARVNATLDQLGPGRAGSVKIQTGFLFERSDMQDLSGSIDLAIPVEIGPGGMLIKWNGSNRVLLRSGRGLLDPADRDVFTIIQMIEGDYAYAEESLRAASNITIAKAGTALGTVELNAVMNGGKHPAVTDVSLSMAGITADTLNLLLQGANPVLVHAGRFDARVEAHLEGPHTSVRGSLTGKGIRLRSGRREASPAVDVSLQHVGSYNSATRDLAIETFTFSVDEGAKTLLSGALDRPVSLHLERAEEGTQSSIAAAEPAVFSLRLAHTKVQELRPWLALMGDDPLKEVTAGRLGASLIVSIYERGVAVDVNGKLESSGVMLKSEGAG
ncbi:hypothetical protein, partial [Petrachloros mirabilis]